MGLDQYAGLRDSNGEVHEEFYWRKHARLQKFFAKQFEKQKGKAGDGSFDLGFNGGEGGVKITEEVVKALDEQVKTNYYDCFVSDGFFWGQQFQEEQVKEYKAQDEKFIKWCKEQLQAGREIGYDCSW